MDVSQAKLRLQTPRLFAAFGAACLAAMLGPANAPVSFEAPAAHGQGGSEPVTACPGEPSLVRFDHELPAVPPALDVVFAFDVTGSMRGVVRQMQAKATSVIDGTIARFDDAQFGVVSFADYPFAPYGDPADFAYNVDQAMTDDYDSVRSAIDRLVVKRGGDNYESYSRVFFEAVHPDNTMGWRSGARKILITFGDDFPHDDDLNEGIRSPDPHLPEVYRTGIEPPYLDPGRSGDEGHNLDTSDDIDFQPALDDMFDANVTLIAIISPLLGTSGLDYWRQWAERTAAGGMAIFNREWADLAVIIPEHLATSTRRLSTLEITVSPPRHTAWVTTDPESYRDIEVPLEGLALGFDVVVTPPDGTYAGEYPITLSLRGDGVEYARRTIEVTIDPICAPLPPPPPPIFLPLSLRESYTPKRIHSDVALILDASSSMTGDKMQAARAAAKAFVDGADLPNNRIAVVGFHTEAWLAHPMTSDAASLRRAIDGVAVGDGTHIDKGLNVALDELSGSATTEEERMQVLILMTDGIQGGDADAPQTLAASARADGIRTYAVGLGADVDGEYLIRLAGASSHYFRAPTIDDLSPVFESLARLLPCPAEEFWGKRCKG